MTQEEKAKAYDEAIKRAQAKMEEAKVFDYDDEQTAHTIRLTTTDIFPELAESEDEKVRKFLLDYLHTLPNHFSHNGSLVTDWIAWLEKQGEQKPVIDMITPEESLGISSEEYNKIVDECVYGEQKPAWSEEDEKLINSIIELIDNGALDRDEKDYFIEKLKFLKERYTWKPSNEQIVTFWDAICNLNHDGYKWIDDLKSLFQDLKKLKK